MSLGLQCPHCLQFNTLDVVKTIHIKNADRRECRCRVCGEFVPTLQKVSRQRTYVIKRDGRRVNFRRENVYRALTRVFPKRKRDAVLIDHLTDKICDIVERNPSHEIKSEQIGLIHLQVLLEENTAPARTAFIHFATEFYDITDPEDLVFMAANPSQLQTKVDTYASLGGDAGEMHHIRQL